MRKTAIVATGRYVPSRVVTNHDLEKWMDTSDEWIQQRTGIQQRHWVPETGEVGASDLGLEASKIALEKAGWQPEEIDLIIFATLSPDIDFPGTGCILQYKLGLQTTPALDIRQQCTAFLYGLTLADAFIKSGHANRILFVGAEVQSTALDISTRGRDMSVLFGDGAGAVCLEGIDTDNRSGLLGSVLYAQGEFSNILMMEAPASKCNPRITEEMIREGRHFPSMDGKAVFKHAVTKLPEVMREVNKRAGLSMEDIDLVIPHQANLRINQAIQKAMNIPEEKMFNTIQYYGNTTAASIPIGIDEAIEKNRITKGNTVLFVALGAGLTWGACIYRFPEV